MPESVCFLVPPARQSVVPIGGAVGALGGIGAAKTIGVDDAAVPLQMTKFNNQDTFERVGNSVVAAKPDGTL